MFYVSCTSYTWNMSQTLSNRKQINKKRTAQVANKWKLEPKYTCTCIYIYIYMSDTAGQPPP